MEVVKRRKQVLCFSACIFIGVCMVGMNSCKDEESCNVPCYFGNCVDNTCNCDVGYEGDSCTVLSIEKILGDWDAIDSCQTDVYEYTATLSVGTVVNQILVSNFGRFGSTFVVSADVNGDVFDIPSQEIQGITLTGSGTIDVIDTVTAFITVNYTAFDGLGNTDTCSGIWTKK